MTDKSINPKKQTVTGVFGTNPVFILNGWKYIWDTFEFTVPLNANNGYDSGINPTHCTERAID